jgi:hypothetical protein
VLLGAALIGWAWSPILADFGGDNAVYWLTAQHWSPWSQHSEVAAYFANSSIYPPLYPALLALSGGGDSVLVAHVVSAFTLAVALFAINAYCATLALGWRCAIGVVFAFVAARITLMEALQLHSEHLYLALSISALALFLREPGSTRALYAAALCVAAAYLTRTFALSLVVAFVIALLAERRRGAVIALAIAIVPVASWSAFTAGDDRYVGALLEHYREVGIGPRLAVNIEWAWRKWVWCFAEEGQPGFYALLPSCLAVAAISGAVLRSLHLKFDGLYALAALGLVAVWPYPAEYERFYYAVLPVLLAQACYAVTVLAKMTAQPRVVPAALALLAAIVVAAELPFLALFGARLATVPDDPRYRPYGRSVAWYYADPKVAAATVDYYRNLVAGLRDIRARQLLPPAACMHAIKPSIASFYTQRLTLGMPLPAAPGSLVERLRKSPCEYLFMTLASSPTFSESFYPYERVGSVLQDIALYPPQSSGQPPQAIFARLLPP